MWRWLGRRLERSWRNSGMRRHGRWTRPTARPLERPANLRTRGVAAVWPAVLCACLCVVARVLGGGGGAGAPKRSSPPRGPLFFFTYYVKLALALPDSGRIKSSWSQLSFAVSTTFFRDCGGERGLPQVSKSNEHPQNDPRKTRMFEHRASALCIETRFLV